jgi:predicted DNA-binding ribbon-helix-helix protein
MKLSVKKRTVVIGGRKTSVGLEDEFWNGLLKVADKRGKTVSELVTSRRFANKSSAIRLCILKFYKDELARQQKQRPELWTTDRRTQGRGRLSVS